MSLFINGCIIKNLDHVSDRNLYVYTEELQGKIIDGCYHDPQDCFSFKIPSMIQGMKIEEDFSDDRVKTVIILDEFGNLVKVDVLIHSMEETVFINSLPERGIRAYLQYIFRTCVLDHLTQQLAEIKQLDEKFIELDDAGKGYLAIIEIPQGSNVRAEKTGRYLDTRRAYLLSLCEDQLVLISAQGSILQDIFKVIGIEIPNNDEELYNKLIEIRKSFNNKNSLSGRGESSLAKYCSFHSSFSDPSF